MSDMFGGMFGSSDDDSVGPGGPRGGISEAEATGLAVPPSERSKFGLCGLENQGMTCYLNSLLQALYMTPEFRSALYSVSPESMRVRALEEIEEEEEEEKRKEKERREKGSDDEDEGEGGEAGGEEGEEKEKEEEKGKGKGRKARARLIPLELQRLFAWLQYREVRDVSTELLTRRGFRWTSADAREQHDIAELNSVLYEGIEKSLKGLAEPAPSLIPSLYRTTAPARLRCHSCGTPRYSEDVGYSLTVPLGSNNLVHSLAGSCAAEQFDLDCPGCGKSSQPTARSRAIQGVAPCLVMTLARMGWDPATFDRIKLTDYFELPLVLDMFHYIEGGPIDKAQEALALAQHAEESGKEPEREGAGGVLSVEKARKQLNEAQMRAYRGCVWLTQLHTPQGRAAARALVARLKALPPKRKALVFDLFSVVMHGGTAQHGHYTAYIRDLLDEADWEPSQSKVEFSKKAVGHDILRLLNSDLEALTPSSEDAKGGGGEGEEEEGGGEREEGKGRDVDTDAKAAKGSDGFNYKKATPVELYARAQEDLSSPLLDLRDVLDRKGEDQGMGQKQLSMSEVGSTYFEITGQTWSKRAANQWGPLKAFLLACNEDFMVIDQDVILLPHAERDAEAEAAAAEPLVPTPSEEAAAAAAGGDGGGGAAGEDEEGWVQVGKDGKASVPAATPSSSSSSSGRGGGSKKLKGVSLDPAGEWGRWFDFNDSSVTPIDLVTLHSSFEGDVSAYLVTYRSWTLSDAQEDGKVASTIWASEVLEEMEGVEGDGVGDWVKDVVKVGDRVTTTPLLPRPSLPPPEPPVYWARRVQKENEELRKWRAEYEELSNKMTILLHFPPMYRVNEGTLLRVDVDKQPEDDEDVAAGGIPLEIDLRWNVARLRDEIANAAPEAVAALHETSPLRSGRICLNMIRSRTGGGGVHVYEAIPDKSTRSRTVENLDLKKKPQSDWTEEEGAAVQSALDSLLLDEFTSFLTSNAPFLVWNGESLHGDAVIAGVDGEPFTAQVTLLAQSRDSGVRRQTHTLTLPRSLTLEGLRDRCAAMLTTMEEVAKSSGGDGEDGSVEGDETVKVKPVPPEHVWIHVVESGRRGKSAKRITMGSRSRSSGLGMVVGTYGITSGTEFYAEDNRVEGGKTRPRALAVKELEREANQHVAVVWWKAGCFVDGTLERLESMVEEAATSGDNSKLRRGGGTVLDEVNAAGEGEIRLTFQCRRETTIRQLKGAAASLLGAKLSDSDSGSGTVVDGGGRCRLGLDGVLVDNEDQACVRVEVGMDGYSLVVEEGAPLAKGEVAFQWALVTGNNTTQSGGGGWRSDMHEYAAPAGHTAQKLKKDLCALALNSAQMELPSGFDEVNDAAIDYVAERRRLRLCSEAGEAIRDGIITDEVFPLSRAGITNGCLLLLEEGLVPKRGETIVQPVLYAPKYADRIIAAATSSSPSASEPDSTIFSTLLSYFGAQGVEESSGGEGDSSDVTDALRDTTTTAGEGGGEGGLGGAPSLLYRSASADEGREATAEDVAKRLRCATLWPLPEMVVKDTWTLQELKQKLLQDPHLYAAHQREIDPAASYDPLAARFRHSSTASSTKAGEDAATKAVKELEASVVAAGDEAPTFATTEEAIWEQIRVFEADDRGWPSRVFKGHERTMKQLKLRPKPMVIQLLDAPEDLGGHDMVLWAQKRIPGPGTREAGEKFSVLDAEEVAIKAQSALDAGQPLSSLCGRNEPVGMPVSVVFRAGNYPTLAQLEACLAGVMGMEEHVGESGAGVRIAKFLAKHRQWKPLAEVPPAPPGGGGGGGGGGGKGRRGKRGRGKKKKDTSLRGQPTLLRDGDLVAVAAVSEDPEGKDDWMREEDYAALLTEVRRRQAIREERKTKGKAYTGTATSRPRRPERGIVIGGDSDFEFESEEEEED